MSDFERKHMKILYITTFKTSDSIASSGTVNAVKRALELAGNEVTVIDDLKRPAEWELVAKIIRKITKKNFDIVREPAVLRKFDREIQKRASQVEYDVVFSQSSILCAYYSGEKPIVFYTDATLGGMLNYYWDEKKWVKSNLSHAKQVESLAMKNADKIILASQWAVNTAIEFHGADPRKCIAINRGANIVHQLKNDDIEANVLSRTAMTQEGQYKMLFVGRDWERKGGPVALQIVKELNQRGKKTKLIVVGCKPLINDDEKEYVELVGFLNKDNSDQNQKLQKLYLTSDFYLQPSRQECQGIAYTEASAFGLPVIATNTGGVGDVVTPQNGILMEFNAETCEYTEAILNYLGDPQSYRDLSMGAFKFYQTTLNWTSVGERLTEELKKIIKEGHKSV